jgi:hypothetical protein
MGVGLLPPELPQLRPARVASALVAVLLRIDQIQVGAADRAKPQTALAAEKAAGKRENQRVPDPPDECELPLIEVRGVELLRVARLLHLPGLDAHDRTGIREAPHARSGQQGIEAEPERISRGGTRDLDARLYAAGVDGVLLAAKLKGLDRHMDVKPCPAAGRQVQAVEVESVRTL